MKFKALFATAVLASLLAGCNEDKQASSAEAMPEQAASVEVMSEEAVLESELQKLSYVLGSNVGAQFRMEEIEIDQVAFSQGLADVTGDVEPRLSQEDVMTIFQKFQEKQMAKQQEQQTAMEVAMNAAGEENVKAGEAFMAENAEKEGVVTLESGLQYKVITAGTGPQPSAEDRVEVHYRGLLLDGTEFDSSYERNETATFGVNQVISGWTEALQLMKEGAKWELYIPSALAYGPGGAGQLIGPNATLIFEVELLQASVN